MSSVSNAEDGRTPESPDEGSSADRRLQILIPHLTRAAELVEQDRLRAGSYLPIEFAQLSLPYRDPKDLPYWKRVNGTKTLIVEPALLPDRDGTLRRAFPFGSVPRLFLIWVTTEVKMLGRTDGQPVRVELGQNLHDFMGRMGLAGDGGSQRRRVMDQLNRLVRARITLQETQPQGRSDGSWLDQGRQLSISSSWSLWHAGNDPKGTSPLMGSYIEVSPEFTRSIDHALPLAPDVLRELQTHPMRLDIYAWLVHRLYNLRREVHVSWKQLEQQFGGNYKQSRQFRAAFKDNLQVVRLYYYKARVVPTDEGLILRPSKRHIPERSDRRGGGDGYEIARYLAQPDA